MYYVSYMYPALLGFYSLNNILWKLRIMNLYFTFIYYINSLQ